MHKLCFLILLFLVLCHAALAAPTDLKSVGKATERNFNLDLNQPPVDEDSVLPTDDRRLETELAGPSRSTKRKTPQLATVASKKRKMSPAVVSTSKLSTPVVASTWRFSPHHFDLNEPFVPSLSPSQGINIDSNPEQVKIKEPVQKQTSELEALHSTRSKREILACTKCTYTSDRWDHLNRHIETHTPMHERTPIPCRLKECGTISLGTTAEARHFRSAHPEEYERESRFPGYLKCLRCPKKFEDEMRLDRHVYMTHRKHYVLKRDRLDAQSGSPSTTSKEKKGKERK